MPAFYNSFEQGVSGNTIVAASSGGNGDNAFAAAVTSGAGSTLTYDNTHAKRGSNAGKFVTAGAAGSTSYAQWSLTGDAQTVTFFRSYLWLGGNPTAVFPIMRAMNGGNAAASVYLGSTRLPQIRNASSTAIATMTNAIPTGQWVRLESKFVHSATVGTAEVRLYNNPDSLTPTETLTATGMNTAANADAFRFGVGLAAALTLTGWMDDIALGTTDWFGTNVAPPPSGFLAFM